MRRILVIFTLLVTAPVSAAADPAGEEVDASASRGWRLSAGFSPALVLLQGFGLEADLMAPRHLRFFASAFTLAIPELFMRDDADEGWSIRDTGAGAGVQVALRPDGRGLFAGVLVETQNHHIERAGQSLDSLELGVAAEIGYRWMPWRGLYITPRLLAVVPLYMSKERELAGESIDEPPVRPVPLLYTGWEF